MVLGLVFVKGGVKGVWGGGGGSWHFFYLILFQGLSFLHLQITLLFAKLCYAFEEKP